MNNAPTSPQVIVSLTSFPAAIPYAVEAIRSVLKGSVLPDKVVLYLDTQKFPNGTLPTELEDLKAATVDKFQDLDGWSLKETDFGFRRPQLSFNPTKWSPVGGKIVTPDDLIADVVTRQGVDFARVRGFHDDITSFHTPGRRWEDIDNAYIETQL